MSNIMKTENAQPAGFGSVVDQIFQNNLSRFFDDDFWGAGRLNRQQVPVNIRETDTTYELELIAPGLSKQDFHLNVTGDTLTVSFEQKQEQQSGDNSNGWIKREYRQQSFTRSFNLDDTVDAEKIIAKYDNGILHVSLPKKENARKISHAIKVS